MTHRRRGLCVTAKDGDEVPTPNPRHGADGSSLLRARRTEVLYFPFEVLILLQRNTDQPLQFRVMQHFAPWEICDGFGGARREAPRFVAWLLRPHVIRPHLIADQCHHERNDEDDHCPHDVTSVSP